MLQIWKTVRIFISSTFRDMHVERNHLVRVVFPELKERCRNRHIQLVDVDLRWGVTEEQAVGGGALDICLDEIDSCRPYFLGLLGYRYGYIPPGHEHSITAEEIYHGVLHNNLPRQLITLRPFVEGTLEGRTLFREQVSCLIRNYRWNPEKRKYLLQQYISPEDENILCSIFDVYSIYQRDRSFFFFRSESLTNELAGSKIGDYFETNETLTEKLTQLKKEIIAADLPYFEYNNLETFGQKVLETLWGRIDVEFPEKREEIEFDWLKEETEFHELFMADRKRRFVGRTYILKTMHDFVENDSDPHLMVITGVSGCGKSALMARFTEEVIRDHTDWLVLSHFVGASPSSTSLRRTLRKLCTQLNRALGMEEEVPEEYKELAQLFPDLLQRASDTRRIIIAIDALNLLEKTDNAHSMRWLPQKLPQNVRVVASTLEGPLSDTLKTWRIQPQFEELMGLTEPEIREFVTGYLGEIRKDFPSSTIREAFYDKIKAGNPLYILVSLEELRIFPVYEELGKRVADLPDTVLELFNQVLERVEGDFNRPLVHDFTSLIACGRQGMTGDELQALLKGHTPILDLANTLGKLPDMLFARLRRSFSAYLFERSGTIDFFHNQLKDAVGKRYIAAEIDRDKAHQIIADYFEKRWKEPYLRALDELAHQFIKAKDWDGLERISCDLHFIEAKCAGGMIYDLVHDYNNALDALPEAQYEKQEQLKSEARLKKYTEDLIAYAKGETKHLDIIPSVELWSAEKIRENTERIINSPTRIDRIRAFSQFTISESDTLVKFALHAGFVIQQAYNWAKAGPVADAANNLVNFGENIGVLLHHPLFRSEYEEYPKLLMTLKGNTERVRSVHITPDGKRAVSGGDDLLLRVWDLQTGECIRTLEGHGRSWTRGGITSVSITADGKRAISGAYDKSVRIWDIENGECTSILKGHKSWITSVDITPDGKKAVSSGGRTIRIWDLENKEFLERRDEPLSIRVHVAITAHGDRVLSGNFRSIVKRWEIKSDKSIRYLKGHNAPISCISVTPDGRMGISGSWDNTLRVWDLDTGECIGILEGHTDQLRSVDVTADGRIAVSGGWDETLRIWDIKTGKCLKTLMGHSSAIQSVSITPDGKTAISAGDDTAIRVWNIEKGSEFVSASEKNVKGQEVFAKITKVHVSNKTRGPFVNKTIELRTRPEIYAVCSTPYGERAISARQDHVLRVWNLVNGEMLQHINTTQNVKALCISTDGKALISGHTGFKGSIQIWDLEKFKVFRFIQTHTGLLMCVLLTPDGRRAISGHLYIIPNPLRRSLKIWDLENGTLEMSLNGGTPRVASICITPDGKTLVSGGLDDDTIVVWDLLTGKPSAKLIDHKGKSVLSVCITPDGRQAISGGADGIVRMWDIRTRQCIQKLEGHQGVIEAVRAIPDGLSVLSASTDATLRVWDLRSGRCLAISQSQSATSSLSEINAKGDFLKGMIDGNIVVLNARNILFEPPIVTPVRIWHIGDAIGEGFWDEDIKANCKWCGRCFSVSDNILDVIRVNNRNAKLSPDQSPCLNLPDETWNEPQLISKCPLCHKLLKFNPFVVDNRGRY